MTNDQQRVIDEIGRWTRNSFRDAFIWCESSGFWFLGPTGPKRLGETEAERFLTRLVTAGAAERQVKVPHLDKAARRGLLSSAGMLCGFGGQACPACHEAAILAPLGARSLAEITGTK